MNEWQQRNLESGDARVVPAVIAGAVAAVVGGAVWAAIVKFANLEVGWVAWGVGLLVGVAMAAVTPQRGRAMAMLAALLAAGGLVAGKTMIIKFATEPALAEEIAADEEWLAEAAAHELYAIDALPEDVRARYDALADDDTIPDALWADMLAAGAAHLEAAEPEDRDSIAEGYASYLLSGIDFMTLLQMQMSLWDLLWFGLAISTAWKIMAREGSAAAEAA